MLQSVYNTISGSPTGYSGTEPPAEPPSDVSEPQGGQGATDGPYRAGNTPVQRPEAYSSFLYSSSPYDTSRTPSMQPTVPQEQGTDHSARPASLDQATAVENGSEVGKEDTTEAVQDKTESGKKPRKGTARPGSHSALFGLGADTGSVKIQVPQPSISTKQSHQPSTKPAQALSTEGTVNMGGEPPVKEASPPTSGTKGDTAASDKMPTEQRSATEKRMVEFGRGRDETAAGGMSSTRASSTDRDWSFAEEHSWLADHL